MDEYLVTEEVAALLRSRPETVRDWRKRHVGPPSFRAQGRVLYPKSGIEQWLAEQRDAERAQVSA